MSTFTLVPSEEMVQKQVEDNQRLMSDRTNRQSIWAKVLNGGTILA
jgi:hypothetical protein